MLIKDFSLQKNQDPTMYIFKIRFSLIEDMHILCFAIIDFNLIKHRPKEQKNW